MISLADTASGNGRSERPEIRLRSYERGDIDAMFRLDHICFAEPFRFSRASMRRFAESRKAQVLIAEAGAELAGFSIVHRERGAGGPQAYLLTVDVAPTFRRRGLAATLLGTAEQAALAEGCVTMSLHVFTGNAGALALYEKRGYIQAGLADDFYGAGRDAWVYRKQLERSAAG